MKKTAVSTAPAHAGNDKGERSSVTPTHPTRVGHFNKFIIYGGLFIALFMAGCSVQSPIGGFALGGGQGRGCAGPRAFSGNPGGGMQVPPPAEMVALERQLDARGQLSAGALEQVLRQRGHSVDVEPKPEGGFHYHWHSVGNGGGFSQYDRSGYRCGGNYSRGYDDGGYSYVYTDRRTEAWHRYQEGRYRY